MKSSVRHAERNELSYCDEERRKTSLYRAAHRHLVIEVKRQKPILRLTGRGIGNHGKDREAAVDGGKGVRISFIVRRPHFEAEAQEYSVPNGLAEKRSEVK